MPELPEVETIVRELKQSAVGKKFWKVEGKLKSVFNPSFDAVARNIKGLRILDVTRRGKYIIFVLEKKVRLVIHLRMTGRLMWKKVRGKEKFICAVFSFSDAKQLIFSDVRKFGKIYLYSEKEFEKGTGIIRLGLEPLATDLKTFLVLFDSRRGILKNTLLRQDVLAGIGNIYADEICFRSGFHPGTRIEKMNKTDLAKLYEAVQHCLNEGILHCGVSVSDFVGTRGTLGKHQNYLQVYGRKGDPCYNCGKPIQKMVAAGRGTFYCLNCQKKK